MKREALKELGLSEEQIESTMALYGQTVNELNKSLATAEQERDQFKEQLDSNQTELDSLKETAKGNDALTQQLADLQTKFDESETASKTALAEKDKDFAIKLALKEANALDESILLNLIDRDTVKVTETGVQGLSEQLDSLKENKAFLFQTEKQPEPTPQITTGGNPNGNNGTPEDPFAAKLAKYN